MSDADLLEGGAVTVVEGRDGWLFVKDYANLDVMGLYTDEGALAESHYEQWAKVLTRRREYFAAAGTAYRTLVVPDACLAYRDKLPAEIELADRSPFSRLAAHLDEPTRQQCVYPLQALIDGRNVQETFQAVDTHWSDWGAWLGYLETMTTLKPSLPHLATLTPENLDWSPRTIFGVLGSTVRPERSAVLPVARIKNPAARRTQHLWTEMRDGYDVTEQNAPELPVAVIFRDSFMTAPAKFFSEAFRRAVYVSSRNTVFYDLIDREQPDVVIHELGESTLLLGPQEGSTTDFRSMYGDLLLDDPQAIADQRRSRWLSRAGRFDDALAANDDALGRTAANARIMAYRARLHISLGHLDAAIEALRDASRFDPTDASVMFFLGQALQQKGLPTEAQSAFELATTIEPRQAAYWPGAIGAALHGGDLRGAAELSKVGAALHPENAALAYAESCVLLALGRLEEAEAAIRRAIAGDPACPQYDRQLASVLIKLGDWPAAHEIVGRLARAAPDDAATAGLLAYVEQRLPATDQLAPAGEQATPIVPALDASQVAAVERS